MTNFLREQRLRELEKENAELRERVRHLDQENQGIHDSFEQADECAEKLWAENSKLRKRVGGLEDALVEADSCLSLIRHRGVVEWGRGIPGIMEVDQLLGRMRKAQKEKQ